MSILIEEIDDVSIIIADIKRATVTDTKILKETVLIELNKGRTKFIFNLRACEFIDSTLLSAIVTSYKRIVEKKGQLKLVGVNPVGRSMFELTSLSKIFDIYDNVQKALMNFN
jgi:anti-sigma B factor antagonist